MCVCIRGNRHRGEGGGIRTTASGLKVCLTHVSGCQWRPLGEGAQGWSRYATLHLLPTAPDALVTAQRMLAKQYHPDTDHGDLAQMVAINTAVERISKAREAS